MSRHRNRDGGFRSIAIENRSTLQTSGPVAKRLFDFTVSLLGLVLLFPVLVMVSIVSLWSQGFPVLYRSKRVGLDGREFVMLKFRSMKNVPETSLITVAGDSRVTRWGKFLRASKLDELPALINVLRGEMSLVGPRPENPRSVSSYSSEQRRILNFVPGITSPASIKYRSEEKILARYSDPEEGYREIMDDKLRIDLNYFERSTIRSDIKLILQTLLTIIDSTERDLPPQPSSQN